MSTDKNRTLWLQWRKSGIGSSDAAAIHNESPYMTPLELYEEKFVNQTVVEESNYILERGNQLEPVARKLFAADYNMTHGTDETFDPENFELKEAPFMRTSTDGASKNKKKGIEIKFQGAEAHEAIKDGKVARHYWIQCQHHLIVAGFESIFLISYNPKAENKIYWTEIKLDVEWAQKHVDACALFWVNGKKGIPPEPTRDDFVMLKKSGMSDKAKELAKLKKIIDDATDVYDRLKKEIEAELTHPKMRVGPIRFTEVERQGAIDYKKVPELKGVNLELYRKAGSKYYKMTVEE